MSSEDVLLLIENLNRLIVSGVKKSLTVTLSCLGRFHHFDLARQLEGAGWLSTVHTGYPMWKLGGEGLPKARIKSFPWVMSACMAYNRLPMRNRAFGRFLERMASIAHDGHVSHVLQPCDLFIGLSGHNGHAGMRAKELGAVWVCDRGSSHIEYQDRILRAAHERLGLHYTGTPSWAIEAESYEYGNCDVITVPSSFAARTFVEMGVATDKVRFIPYGVDVGRFYKVSSPDDSAFDVIFVGEISVRKGIPDLLEAFRLLRHPRKRLTLIGLIDSDFAPWIYNIKDTDVRMLGAIPQSELKEYLSRSHVFVLPSMEDGFGLVMAQSMACGCPVIATENTGAPDLLTHGVDGWILPINAPEKLAAAMQNLIDTPGLRENMSRAALEKIDKIGGWSEYGEKYMAILAGLSEHES